MKSLLGVILIGQTPRKDHEENFSRCISKDDQLMMLGALDDLSLSEIQNLKPAGNEGVLATLSREGVPIVVPETEIIQRIPEKIKIMEKKGADLIVIVCTGEFPKFAAKVPLVFPSRVLTNNVKAVAEGSKVGIILPLREQFVHAAPKWAQVGVEPVFEAVSPFTAADSLKDAVKNLTAQGVMLIVLDCMKYDQQIKEEARLLSGLPVIAARTMLEKYVSELFAQ